MKRLALWFAAIASMLVAALGWLRSFALSRRLQSERAARIGERADHLQSRADAEAEKKRAAAAKEQADKIAALNREVVHADSDDLADAFDRATGRRKDDLLH
jgi:hypothetical protein